MVSTHKDDFYDRDGASVRFFEQVPFAGLIVAAIHASAGNKEHAKRALTLCTSSSIVSGGTVIGALLGGPVGGAIGAGLITPLALLAEATLAGTIKDPQLQAQFEKDTLEEYLGETLENTLVAGLTGDLATHLGGIAGQIGFIALGGITWVFGRKAIRKLSEVAARWLFRRALEELFERKKKAKGP